MTSCTPRRNRESAARTTSSTPFCSARRAIMARSGARGCAGRPIGRWRAAFQSGLGLPRVEERAVESHEGQVEGPEAAWVGDVVQREEGTESAVTGTPAVQLAQVDRYEPRLPVIEVQDVRPVIEQRQRFQHCPAE